MEWVKRVYQVAFAIEGRNQITTADGIIYQGSIWAVPEWIEAVGEGRKRPRRMIRLPSAHPSQTAHDFFEPSILPADLFDLSKTPQADPQLRTIEDPDVWVLIPRAH